MVISTGETAEAEPLRQQLVRSKADPAGSQLNVNVPGHAEGEKQYWTLD